jgi:hypothetical protein
LSQVIDPDATRYRSWRDPMGSAVLGSRPKRTPLFLPADVRAPEMRENFAPLWRDVLRVAQQGLAAANGTNGRFTVSMQGGDTSSDFSENADGTIPDQAEEPVYGSLDTGMRKLGGRFRDGAIATTYQDCRGSGLRRTMSGGRIVDPASGLVMDLPGVSSLIFTANGVGAHGDGIHMIFGPPGAGCHGAHEHYGSTLDPDRVHGLANGEALYPLEALGFVLPDQNSNGAGGAWGQPKLPVLISQSTSTMADPFNLTVGLRFTQSGSRFDMKEAASDALVSSAAGMAYYHRRGHLGEPPNLLNPFWRATLAPMEIDERSRRDPTRPSQVGPPAMQSALSGVSGYAEKPDALRAYRMLRTEIDGMEKAPERN